MAHDDAVNDMVMPGDMQAELYRHDAWSAWQALPPSRQRDHLDAICSAPRAKVRSERIGRCVDVVLATSPQLFD